MSATPVTRLLWNGRGSVQQAKEMLSRQAPVELILPADFHHAIFSRLDPRPRQMQAELLDVEGGSELLEKIARIKQLGEVGELIEAVRRLGVEVQVKSPAPRIILRQGTSE